MSRNRLNTLIEIAILSALSFVLSKVQFAGFWPNGGSVSLVMVPIAVLAFRRGVVAGLISGVLVGLLKAIFGGYVIHPLQFILEYPIAFGVLGLASLFFKPGQQSKTILPVVFGITFASSLRLLCHTVAGVIWFGSGQSNVWLFSFGYNAGYIIPEIIITSIVVGIFYYRFSFILKPNLK